jgi:hypothetical protein
MTSLSFVHRVLKLHTFQTASEKLKKAKSFKFFSRTVSKLILVRYPVVNRLDIGIKFCGSTLLENIYGRILPRY